MEKEFDLGTILTGITGKNVADNFNDFWDLVWFIEQDKLISPFGLLQIRDEIREHLISIHPQLADVEYNLGKGEEKRVTWLKDQKATFGDTLMVCPMGQTLKEDSQKLYLK